MTRYIFVTGGVASSLGKGLAAAALGSLLQARGFRVRLRKYDPYLNVDPGTMSPFQHGEVYITDDGAETDLDLGHYERFTGVSGRRRDSVSSGQIYSHVIEKERRGDYLGATVQVIPHITDAIKQFIREDLEEDLDFLICEVGGTVGDIEGLPFLEAFRQFANEIGRQNALFIHLTLIPYIASAQELKTKPSQHSVKELLHVGIQPDILLCRSEHKIPESAKQKLALFCNIKPECVIDALDVDTIYQVPISYSEAGLDRQVCQYFGIDTSQTPDLSRWKKIVDTYRRPQGRVKIIVVGKYTGLQDAYKSLNEALIHGGMAHGVQVDIDWIDGDILEDTAYTSDRHKIKEILGSAQGILVPGGYGVRGTEGMIRAIQYARENQIPFLGICFGMQLAVIEFARHVLGLEGASSTEFGPTAHPVVSLLTEWKRGEALEQRSSETPLGGTMRLGAYDCVIKPGSLAQSIYGKEKVSERHRHRYEVNVTYRASFEQEGLVFSGMSPDQLLPEMVEYTKHPWFFGLQPHPEFKSRPFEPHPVFKAFIEAVYRHSQGGKV